MKLFRRLARSQDGATIVEMAFALPIMIMMIWMILQFALVYRAVAGIQQALGEGARYATLCLTPTSTGCVAPTATEIRTKINDHVFGIGPGTFTVPVPTLVTAGTSRYYDLTVNYSQATDMLIFPGPTVTVSRSKRVWVAGT
jgi:Flp pilus assembly protein TadG